MAPGLRDYEASFLRLLDRMTDGTRIEINNTGTQVKFHPGVLIGGEHEHVCPVASNEGNDDGDDDDDSQARSIGWYLEGILPLAPFGKEPLHVVLEGITDGTCAVDPSPDYLKTAVLPWLTQFGVGGEDQQDFSSSSANPYIRVIQRGAAPLGGGKVEFHCPIVRNELRPIDVTDPGLIKRIRGTVVSCKIPPSSAARAAHSAKGLFLRLLPDVWITTDVHSSRRQAKSGAGTCGPSPGMSLVLTAETTSGTSLTAECCLDARKQKERMELPEDLGQRGAAMLLEEIRRGGCLDTHAQSIILLWMCLGPEDVARVRIGTLTPYTIQALRLYKQILGVEFKVQPDMETKTVVLSCLGIGYRNMARAST